MKICGVWASRNLRVPGAALTTKTVTVSDAVLVTSTDNTILATHSIKNTLKSRFPANNVHRQHEPVATDMVFADVPAIYSGGCKMAQGFVGRYSMVADVYLMGSQKEFVQTLTDQIRHRGAMDMLISDRGEAEISHRVKDILRMYVIDDFQSEPHQHNQNFFERWWQVIKRLCITILGWSGANSNEWFLVLEYVAYICNRTAVKSLGWMTPLEKLTGL